MECDRWETQTPGQVIPRHSSSLFCSSEAKPLEAVGPPFARVMVVVAGSPADSAGLKQGDSMTKFGSVTKVSRSIHNLPMFTVSTTG